MKYKNTLIAVSDMEKSKEFYRKVLGLRVVSDFGANITLTGGLSLQTVETYADFLQKEISDIHFKGNDAEIYFEEDNFDAFLQKLQGIDTIEYVHTVYEHAWGQRVVRFYDLDHHIIEVGENLSALCKRFAAQGMTIAQIAERMDIDEKYVRAYMR